MKCRTLYECLFFSPSLIIITYLFLRASPLIYWIGRLGLIIFQNCLCEKKIYTVSHYFTCCRKGRQKPPPLTFVNFTNTEETWSVCGEKRCFWFSKPCSSLFRTANGTRAVFKLLIYSNTVLNGSFFSTWIGLKT